MGLSADGLTNGGGTEHFLISYDDALPEAEGLDIAIQVFNTCETDYAMMVDWFSGQKFLFNYPISVNIMTGNSGASWVDPSLFQLSLGYSPTVTVMAGPGATADLVRYLVVSEITEMLMASQNNGWFEGAGAFEGGDEGSKGEGLSRFLGQQFKVVNGTTAIRYPKSEVVKDWLNAGRPDHVDDNMDDHAPDAVTGCATAFIFYLHSQLDFSIQKITAAGASSLAGVYTKLTGKTDGWASFIQMVNQYYPAGPTYDVPGDKLFPVANLATLDNLQYMAGESGQSRSLALDNQAPTNVIVAMSSDNPGLVSVPATIVVPAGQWAAAVPVSAAAVVGPAQSTTIHASYAGRTLDATVEVLPRPSALSGQVTDGFGVGLADATIGIAPDDPNAGLGADLQLSTDEFGNYQTPPLAPGDYIVSASQGAYVPQQATVIVAEGVPITVANFALELTLPFTVEGQVTSQAGAAVVGAKLTLSNSESAEDFVLATTDDNGAYSLTLLPHSYDRVFELSVVAPGFVRIDTTVAPPNGATVQLPIQLIAFGSLSGAINDTTGAPVSGATLAGGGVTGMSDDTGAYSLAGLTPGEVDLTITSPGFDTLATSLVITSAVDTVQNFALTPATAVITGTIVNAIDLSPMSGVPVLLGVRRTKTDDAGVYQFTAVSSGQQTVSTGGWGAHGQQRVVQVVDHQMVVVDFTFSPARHKGDPVPQ